METIHQIRPEIRAAAAVAVLAAVVLLAGCRDRASRSDESAPSDAGAAQRGFDSPQAAFDGLKAAVSAEDWNAAAQALTAESQQELAGTLMFMAGFIALFDEQHQPELEGIFKKHGLDTDTDEERELTDLGMLAEPLRDKPAFIAEMFGWMQEHADETDNPADSLNVADGRLENLDVQGETAAGEVVTAADGGERREPIEFRRIDGRWFVHLSFDDDSDDDFSLSITPGPAGAAGEPPDPQDEVDVEVPDRPVSGTLFGREFRPDRFELSQSGSILTIRQGKDFFADAEIKLFLFLDEGESPAARRWNVTPRSRRFHNPHVHAAVRESDGRGRTSEIYTDGYTLFLEFGEATDDRLTGRIHLTLPGEQSSEIAGTFQVELPEDPDQPPGERHKPSLHGRIDFKPNNEDWLRSGYVGVTAEGERQSNMVGRKAGPATTDGWAESTTYQPRISRINLSADDPPSYRHVRLEPGTYFVYAKWGEHYLSGRWLEVGPQSALTVNFELNPDESGTLEATIPSDARQKSMRLLPLDDEGELPAAVSADQARSLAFTLGLSVEATDDRARFDALRPGSYRVFFDNQSKDVTVQEGEGAGVDFRE